MNKHQKTVPALSQEHPSILAFWRQPLGLLVLLLYFTFSIIIIAPSVTKLIDGAVGGDPEIVGHDYRVFYAAGTLTNAKKFDTLYDSQKFENTYFKYVPQWQNFSYPPTILLLFAPLSKLSYIQAFTLWISLSAIALILTTYLISKSYLVVAMVMISPLFWRGIFTGQTGLITAALMGCGLYALWRNKPVISGISFGLLIIKPHLALALPLCLLITRDWKIILSGIATVMVTIAVSYLAFGAEVWQAFFAGMGGSIASELPGEINHNISLTFWNITLYITNSMTIAGIVAALGTVFALYITVYIWKNTTDIAPRAVSLILLPAFASPYFHFYDAVPLLIVFALMARDLLYKKTAPYAGLMMLTIWVFSFAVFRTQLFTFYVLPFIFLIGLNLLAYVQTKESLKD